MRVLRNGLWDGLWGRALGTGSGDGLGETAPRDGLQGRTLGTDSRDGLRDGLRDRAGDGLAERQSADDVGFFRSMTSKLCAVYYLLFSVLAIWPVSASAGEASSLMRITTSLSSLPQPGDAFRQPQGRRPTRRTEHHEGRKYRELPNSIFV